jgi:hypothetical protein
VNIYGGCSMKYFGVIETMDDSQPYPEMMGMEWNFDN